MKTIFLSFVVLFYTCGIFAQKVNDIEYLDFEPDTAASFPHDSGSATQWDTIILDFNKDSDGEIMFYFAETIGHFYGPHYATCNQQTFVCKAFNDSLASNSITWFHGPRMFSDGDGERFGIKIVEGENSYYGWYRAYANSNDSLMFINIDKMAYCTIPNYPLLWGQTEISNSVPKTDAGNDGVKINFSNAANTVQIESLTKIKDVEIVSSTGQIVKKVRNVGKSETEINASGLQSGVYIVKVSLDDGRVVSGKVVR